MKTSLNGIQFIEQFESFQPKAYHCPTGILTIGYGHTGPDVHEDQVIDQDTATVLMMDDLTKVEKCINDHVIVPLSQNQFDALVSLTFNIGCGAFTTSTLLKIINDGRPDQAALQFVRWDHIGSLVSQGLLRRRTAEQALYMKQ